ncbi:hypothetical protein V6Z12_D11G225000 [Gossypium hirsutum]
MKDNPEEEGKENMEALCNSYLREMKKEEEVGGLNALGTKWHGMVRKSSMKRTADESHRWW